MLPYEYMDREILKRAVRVENGGLFRCYPYLDMPKVRIGMERYYKSGYFRFLTLDERLNKLLVPDLKKILSGAGQPVSGKKALLIQRIKDSVPIAVVDEAIPSERYITFTPEGRAYYDGLCLRFDTEYDNLVDDIRESCLRKDFRTAYHNMCVYEAKQFFKRGLGIDWQRRSEMPMNSYEYAAAYRLMDQAEDKQWAASSIAYNWLGSPSRFRAYMNKHPEFAVKPDLLHYGNSLLCTFRKLAEYEQESISEYKIVGADGPCEVCQAHRNRTYRTRKAQIGVNCPPFHVGCRCCITPVVTFDDGTEVRPVIRGPGRQK